MSRGQAPPAGWTCPICGGADGAIRWQVPAERTEAGVDAAAFRPSASAYGHTVAPVVHCARCSHGSVAGVPDEAAVSSAYADAADPVSLREEPGQVETARRVLARVERSVPPGRVLDVGCWTGSFLVAAAERGWTARGYEPSTWAAGRARERGADVVVGSLADAVSAGETARLVVLADVIEHLDDPVAALRDLAGLLDPDGAVLLMLPDAGSRLARALGARWWSVLPMHLHYFSRGSMARALDAAGLRPLWFDSHPKCFTAGYYADALAGFAPPAGKPLRALLDRVGRSGRMVAPDLHDRMAVLAVRR